MPKKQQQSEAAASGLFDSKSPVAPQVTDWPNGVLHQVAGFRTAAVHCGLKRRAEKPDLAVLVCEQTAAAAGVFTTNRVCAAPVRHCQRVLAKTRGRARAIIVNAGNANACTGAQGEKDAAAMAKLAAQACGVKAGEVLVCSTGVIGRPMPMEKITRGLKEIAGLFKREERGAAFERAIMTTDLVRKTAAVEMQLGGQTVRLAGACKGSGMIAPNMATMLGFLATDAACTPEVLHAALQRVTVETFNCLTVDGDTSTNDTVLLLASGAAANPPLTEPQGPDFETFCAGLYRVCDSLARQVAADGEGAQHLVTVYVGGTATDEDARRIARTIAESPLVKTAIAGNDPNWGRIMAAAGRSGVDVDPETCVLTVNGFELYQGGVPAEFDAAAVSKALDSGEVSIVLLTGDGPGRAKMYTCDMTHGYITINADYHT